jgi:hypothetical protein
LNTKTIYRGSLIIIFLLVFASLSRSISSTFHPPFEAVEVCSNVLDGDTFDTSSGYRIRLADIDTPESGELGYFQSWGFVSDWILGKSVYLDIDNINVYDTIGTRLVCVVYVEVETGKYLNLNKAMLEQNLAVVWDHDNEFNPYSWSLYVHDLTDNQRILIVGFSFFSAIAVVFLINILKNRSVKLLTARARKKITST